MSEPDPQRVTLHIDGDSCPRQVRDTAARAGRREGVAVVCYANRPIPFDKGLTVEMVIANLMNKVCGRLDKEGIAAPVLKVNSKEEEGLHARIELIKKRVRE